MCRHPCQICKYTPLMHVLSNGWDESTAALQLLSHLEGYALNVAILVPVPRQASRVDLVDALSVHYGSTGGLQETV